MRFSALFYMSAALTVCAFKRVALMTCCFVRRLVLCVVLYLQQTSSYWKTRLCLTYLYSTKYGISVQRMLVIHMNVFRKEVKVNYEL